ncbi:uncharacterized protein L3040_005292 [Drepanopeziza brunnea f. sp. 'multigermtubi']|uniref:uncharacterized protein n=1 Tax=Drepanopeziza brunnea f. sp. 'multigermtubi' TaxID=698441 RepID=UPI002385AD9B|nr:hypothetical protein L3040_005292 [Drepanopeziza brunnea f. sp. 'multigermtubi']
MVNKDRDRSPALAVQSRQQPFNIIHQQHQPNTTAGPSLPVRPLLAPNPTSAVDSGLDIDQVELENVSEADFQTIRDALDRSHVVRFDPSSERRELWARQDARCPALCSVLHPDLQTIPTQPQVPVSGNGTSEEHDGLKNIKLVQLHHKTFPPGRYPAILAEDDLHATRFYRWHLDAALYDLNPGPVTSLVAVTVPAGRRPTLRYHEGTGEERDVPPLPFGTTAFRLRANEV